jgi:hypothetical protein
MVSDSLSESLLERLRLLERERAQNVELRHEYAVLERSAFVRLGAFVARLRRSRSLGAVAVAALVTLAAAASACASPASTATPPGVRDVSASCAIHGRLQTGAVVGIDAFAKATGRNESGYEVYGWGKDRTQTGPARAVCLIVDGRVDDRVTSLYGERRPDVAKVMSNPDLLLSGYLIKIPAGSIPAGSHRIGVAVVSADGSIAASNAVRTITFP